MRWLEARVAERDIDVSVIVPALDAAATLPATLAALASQDFAGSYEVIVVDDGSSDATREVAAAAGGEVRLLKQERCGPGPARNRGAASARGSILAFTDADCVPAVDWLREGVVALGNADLVQGRVRPDPGVRLGPFDHTVWVVRESGLYETANLFVSRRLFESLGGFEDFLRARIGKPLAEDTWFGWRARRSGARTTFCDAAVVIHAVLPRGAAEYVRERLRAGYFPSIARQIPELRTTLFWRQWFLSGRSAAFDAAGAGAFGALVARHPLPLVLAIPYAAVASRRAWRWRARAPQVALVDVAADAVALAALAWGSLRERTPVL
jgi:glycosyltransferase involved in cell wall biosynthesis